MSSASRCCSRAIWPPCSPSHDHREESRNAFDAGALVARVEGFTAGRRPARERTVKLPPPVKPIPTKQIHAIRFGLGCTQTEFATLLNVPAVTAISWENGTRKPSGAALRLLAVARHLRGSVAEELTAHVPETMLPP